MEIREHNIPFHLPLAHTYVTQYNQVADLYDYAPFAEDSYNQRAKQVLKNKLRVDQARLIQALQAYNQKVGNHFHSIQQIEGLQDERALVVIGGQQPGLLTGPLYTIYKAITILQLAKREEERLGVPVVPVFWIAGEDHDWDEVNQLFGSDLKKYTFKREQVRKTSISYESFEQDDMIQFVNEYFDEQMQTQFTHSIKEQLQTIISQCTNLSDFFARLLIKLFGEDGLVLIDSADTTFRQIEGEMFATLIAESKQITDYLQKSSELVRAKGFTPQVETLPDHTHLFMYDNGERLPLLFYSDHIKLRNRAITWSVEELQAIARTTPEMFSCNVVTRPLMQEYLFPVLAFVGGPGEISYWGLYRDIFHHFGFRLPIIVPRINGTIVEGSIQKLLSKYELTLQSVVEDFEHKRACWLNEQDSLQFATKFKEVRQEIKALYQPLIETITQVEKGLHKLGETNLQRILSQIDFLEGRTQLAFENRHAVSLGQFERIKNCLIPDGKPQERLYNIFYFINKYGWGWWDSFKQKSYTINDLHKEILL